jgi:hypothetical protein
MVAAEWRDRGRRSARHNAISVARPNDVTFGPQAAAAQRGVQLVRRRTGCGRAGLQCPLADPRASSPTTRGHPPQRAVTWPG